MAKPDGHTLLLMDIGSLAVAPSLFPDLSYNVESDLAPVGMVDVRPLCAGSVNPSVPAKDRAGTGGYAKANPGNAGGGQFGRRRAHHITAVALARTLGSSGRTCPIRVARRPRAPWCRAKHGHHQRR